MSDADNEIGGKQRVVYVCMCVNACLRKRSACRHTLSHTRSRQALTQCETRSIDASAPRPPNQQPMCETLMRGKAGTGTYSSPKGNHVN